MTAVPLLIGFHLSWIHPRLSGGEQVKIDHPIAASRLGQLFEDYYLPLEGVPYDCPMYDVIVTLHAEDSSSTALKVYLPRARTFPGMWKHPGGVLCCFEPVKSQPRLLVEMLHPYIPSSPVYPAAIKHWPPVQFNKGIPDFRQTDLPISGDFAPTDFFGGRPA